MTDLEPTAADDTPPSEEERQALEAKERAPLPDGTDLHQFVFADPLMAQEALLAALRLQRRGQLGLEDAAVVTKDARDKVRIAQTKDVSPGQGALAGGWWGTLAGLLVGGPLVGAALGAAAGGLFGRLRDIGINDDDMRSMGEELEPGEGALFLLVSDCHRLRALHEVSRFAARLAYTTLDAAAAEEVRERLAVDPWG